MKPVIKILLLFSLLIVFLIIMCFFFASSIKAQFIYFLLINILFLSLKGISTFWQLAKYWYRFSIVIIFIFSLSWFVCHWIRYDYLCNNLSFECYKQWLLLGANTSLMLVNTVFTIELVILSVTINDILTLPVSINYLKVLILARTLLIQATTRFNDNQILLKTIPDFQPRYKRSFKNMKILFHKNLILTLTFVLYIDEQSKIIGQLIDNRIKHTFK